MRKGVGTASMGVLVGLTSLVEYQLPLTLWISNAPNFLSTETIGSMQEVCTSAIGHIGQLLYSNVSNLCQQVNVWNTALISGMILGGLLFVIGLVMMATPEKPPAGIPGA